MKNISNIITALLLIAVVYLLIDKFSSKSNNGSEEITAQNDGAQIVESLKIAYLNVDSLNNGYQYITDQQKILEKETTKVQGGIQFRMKKAEKRMTELQEQLPGMTQQQYEAAQNELITLENNIKKYENDQGARLQKIQYDFQDELKAELDSFLTPFKAKYDFIFSYADGSELLYAEQGYDISDTLIQLMNEHYLSTKEASE